MKLLIDTEWATFISDLSEEKQLEFFWAVFDYGNRECNLNCWNKIKPLLESGKIKYYNRLNNLKQYRSESDTESDTERVPEWEYKTQYKIKNINPRNNVCYNNTTRAKETEKGVRGAFIAPTLEEILTYAKQMNDTAGMGGFVCGKQTAIDFFNQYDRQGWLLGNGNHMTNWKSGLRRWADEQKRKLLDE
jgi:hypothetical protein